MKIIALLFLSFLGLAQAAEIEYGSSPERAARIAEQKYKIVNSWGGSMPCRVEGRMGEYQCRLECPERGQALCKVVFPSHAVSATVSPPVVSAPGAPSQMLSDRDQAAKMRAGAAAIRNGR